MTARVLNGSGIPSLMRVAAWVFVAIFCTHIAVTMVNRWTAVEPVSDIRIELKPSESDVRPPPLWVEYVVRSGRVATFGTILVCAGFVGWRRSLPKARN